MTQSIRFPLDPLTADAESFDDAARRRAVVGVLDSYHGTYDIPSEAIQNAVDAVEDAALLQLGGPYRIEIHIDLNRNTMSFLDTGVGMEFKQVARAFAPHVSYKVESIAHRRRSKSKNLYRGFKGIGMTFLAYSSDRIIIHSKKDGTLTKAQMKYGHSWAIGERRESALLVKDEAISPLNAHSRGTYVEVQFSGFTRPKHLRYIAQSLELWKAIFRTRTAIGQVLLEQQSPVVRLDVELSITKGNDTRRGPIQPTFLYPHEVKRPLPFRFLDAGVYYHQNPETSRIPIEKRRQDGIYVKWNSERIVNELSDAVNTKFKEKIKKYIPDSYAFVPYQGSVWRQMNQLISQRKNRKHIYPGLMIAVNRQRLADVFNIAPSRFATFGNNVFVVVHYHGAKPDHGRKTIDSESMELACKIGDRLVQYLAKQREFLRHSGEEEAPGQREAERDHEDWKFNVRTHHRHSPLHIPPVCYQSTPLTEQDVIGLFNQLCAVGVFAGMKIYATSQSRTYDCLAKYDCGRDHLGLAYSASHGCPLGVSPSVLGDGETFMTRFLTVEFKNNLDALIDDIDAEDSRKRFTNIDICVCWSTSDSDFSGYILEEITEDNVDRRKYPGCTHLLYRDVDSEAMELIMLKTVVELIQSDQIRIPPLQRRRL